ncbi:hypothetical protein OS493_030054 [Desmophyllum pertusum]|uniref:SCP domain-containing protein n=1 Tax=Desmophyllum pertusum TaxID=174260 RepID=A0A9W9ZAR3_9CNID|nr:hypothetical protein OS493_030054 [Desmophyllum pertusum]
MRIHNGFVIFLLCVLVVAETNPDKAKANDVEKKKEGSLEEVRNSEEEREVKEDEHLLEKTESNEIKGEHKRGGWRQVRQNAAGRPGGKIRNAAGKGRKRRSGEGGRKRRSGEGGRKRRNGEGGRKRRSGGNGGGGRRRSGGGTGGSRRRSLKDHNTKRAQHGSPDLVWDNALANDAKRWADHLASKTGGIGNPHEPNIDEGENIAMGTGITPQGACATAVKLWYDEIKYYTKPGFNPRTGHFTQVVWKSSTKLGMAAVKTKDGKAYWVVARYKPPGNVGGQFEQNVSV